MIAKVYPDMAAEYLEGFNRAEIIIQKYLPSAKINTPPLDPLANFVTPWRYVNDLVAGL